jgi:arginine/lysine/ornithine decarboxylase
VKIAHEHHMAVLVDEAHGAHYYFHAAGSPITAMDAGADMSSVSFHKTAGSLTQSSVLLMHTGMFSRYDVQKSLNIINTTSPSHLLIASIDGARSYMATEGKAAQERTYGLAEYAREEVAKIPGFVVEGKEHFMAHGCYRL